MVWRSPKSVRQKSVKRAAKERSDSVTRALSVRQKSGATALQERWDSVKSLTSGKSLVSLRLVDHWMITRNNVVNC